MAMVKRMSLSEAFGRVAEDFVRGREEKERKGSVRTTGSEGSGVSPKTMPGQPSLQQQMEVWPATSDLRIDSPVYSFVGHAQAQPQSQTSYYPPRSALSTSSSSSSLHTLDTQPQQQQSHTYTQHQQTSSSQQPPEAALLSHIQTALDASDLSDIWSDLAGVLYWLSLVVCAASSASSTSSFTSSSASVSTTSASFSPFPQPLQSHSFVPPTSTPTTAATGTHDVRVLLKWFRALSVRCAIKLCFEHEDAVLATLGVAGRVVEACAFGDRHEGGKKKKRRRT